MEVTLLGESLKVRTDGDPVLVREILGYVQGRLQEVEAKAKGQSQVRVALLAALNVAEEFFRYRERREKIGLEAREKVQTLIGLIDSYGGERVAPLVAVER